MWRLQQQQACIRYVMGMWMGTCSSRIASGTVWRHCMHLQQQGCSRSGDDGQHLQQPDCRDGGSCQQQLLRLNEVWGWFQLIECATAGTGA